MVGESFGAGDYKATNGRLYKVSDSGEGTPLAWYPAPGYRYRSDGALRGVGSVGYNWSSAVSGVFGQFLWFGTQDLDPSNTNYRANGRQLRCLSE